MKKKTHHLQVKMKHSNLNKPKIPGQPQRSRVQEVSAEVLEDKLAVLEARQQQKAKYYMGRINELTSILAKQGNTRSLLNQQLNQLSRQMQHQQQYLFKVKTQYLGKSLQASLIQSQIIQSQYFGTSTTNPELLISKRQNVNIKKKGKSLYRSLQHYRSQMSLSARNEDKEPFKRKLDFAKMYRKDR